MTLAGQGAPILQSRLPFTPWDDPALSRMPGMTPVEGPWIVVDDAYAPQMRERTRLLATARDQVIGGEAGTDDLQIELLDHVLTNLPAGFRRYHDTVICPDGRSVTTKQAPFAALAGMVQEDFLILERRNAEHVLIAGLLCFPASWTLTEKIGRPLTRIHAPVPNYNTDIGRRVQRLFDRVPQGRAIWRANALGYADADLHQPRMEAAPKREVPARYLRCERHTVLRLPHSDAIAFAVHTYVVTPQSLTARQYASCPVVFADQGAAKCLDSFSP
ncbi:heme-dependent oxidative N-demethylase family protein [Jannaschia donghaensis]|uniref:DUF3445 domain-containing protein n=1 Tax=Jannaschia donghaensis TaxID=420998 RepID=A0A0M6YIV1_9RHOB|nr:DUF3445 domain-containing protein [Jannaschia donghaensis]CTQ50292.1 hypothetical protein JDO7802_02312 [Jannaschia donghaensis]